MPTDRYNYQNLDNDGDWVYNMPTDVASTGEMFDNQCCNGPTLPQGNHNTAVAEQDADQTHQYPDPGAITHSHLHPYFADDDQRNRVRFGDNSHQHDLNPKAPPFFVPTPAPSEPLQQDKTNGSGRALYTGNVPQVVDDTEQAEASAAARCASRRLSKSLRRRFSATTPPLQRRPAPQLANKEDTLASTASPLNVQEWTANQTNAFHLGVGTVRMSMPQKFHSGHAGSPPVQSMSPPTSGVAEPYPCTYEGCTAVHKPFMTKSAREKHMKSHQPKSQLPYHCDHCKYRCRYPRELERHSSVHISDDDEQVQQCPICQRTFRKRKDNLDRHLKTCHSEEAAAASPSGVATPSGTSANTSFTLDQGHFPPLPPTPTSLPR